MVKRMNTLNLSPKHQAVKAYYNELSRLTTIGKTSEGAVSPAFAALLRSCARQYNWTLVEQYSLQRGTKTLRIDGALVDSFHLVYGYWEAKDEHDDLDREVQRKFEVGYPRDNILFQAPNRAILYQDGRQILDQNLDRPDRLVAVLKTFFEYQPPAYEEWQKAVEEFKLKVPELAAGLLKIIEQERRKNPVFIRAFAKFADTCRTAINPNLSVNAIEEMLIQHLLTERLFSKVFDNPYFLDHNAVARDIKEVIRALTSRHFSPREFLRQLNRFYVSIESTASLIDDFTQKQAFLNTIYEKFFQGYAVKVADTHGIVYTPQPIVRFMVNSVEEILHKEFGRSLSDHDVHILDPFVGTGNFLIHVMRKVRKTALRRKYEQELHCNEVMLLPYYIASMNIEHEYYELTGEYTPFEGICFVDTFELAEERQLSLFTEENTARVERQKQTPIFVVIGNPPYNAGQANENDNNKNRKYPTMDRRVAETYAKDSSATNKNALSDVYVKAIRWASDRIGAEGIVAFVTNNSFIDGIAFDGMRKHLAQDFDAMYILDLGGNVRRNPKLSGTTHNVFGIQVGVSISLFIKKKSHKFRENAQVFYARLDEFWRKEQKYDFLDSKKSQKNITWNALTPDKKYNWLTEGMSKDFDTFLPMGTKAAKFSRAKDVEAIFKIYGRGVGTSRDAWAYNFSEHLVANNMKTTIEFYNEQVGKWIGWLNIEKNSNFYKLRLNEQKRIIDDFVTYNDRKLSWTRDLKKHFKNKRTAEFSETKIRSSLYRPFTKTSLFFDNIMNNEGFTFFSIFPTPDTENENRVICVVAAGGKTKFYSLMTNILPDLHLTGDSQCFPFYTYEPISAGADQTSTGSAYTRRENITDWALKQFREHYLSSGPSPARNGEREHGITKWDIFYYVYAILHHSRYREQYAANLKRELPRIPFAPDFWGFAEAGKRLAALHVHYEEQAEYPLQMIENDDVPLNWRVEKMKLVNKRKDLPPGPLPTREGEDLTPGPLPAREGEHLPSPGRGGAGGEVSIIYNEFLTLSGIPPEAFDYRLGNRSALEWGLDQYRVKTDKRSGITNDPNREDDPEYIVRLIKQVVTVSVDTVHIVNGLPELEGRN